MSNDPVMQHDWKRPEPNTVHVGEAPARDETRSKNYEANEVCCRYRPNADPLTLLRLDMGGKRGKATIKYGMIHLVRSPNKKIIEIETHSHIVVIKGNQLGTLYDCLGEARVLTIMAFDATKATEVPDGQATVESITVRRHGEADED